jgi:8-oxo-dGTP pyrophosphatase MutT (NUDIX family)
MQTIRIYHLNRFITLSSTSKDSALENNVVSGINSYRFKSKNDLEKLIDSFLEDKNADEITIFAADLNNLLSDFISLFSNIEAAGGIVYNKYEELLVICRFGKVDLPKGKIEKGESNKNAALREVSEECGITSMKIIEELKPTYHVYSKNNRRYLKKTYWFKMFYKGKEKLMPQTEEGITQVKWIQKNEVSKLKNFTYKSLEHFFETKSEI